MDPTSAFHRVSSGGAISNTAPVTEKPFHYTYLKEFRVEQCRAFLQHKCNQHRPFTCFQWHFMNQRRRRPVKRRDGTFNYSPDVYCTFYDETSGICPNGDECPYLHRTAGDTERRYHLRYYKTSTCVYETDSRGYCVKNGPHCAFAHGPHDLRPPVYDVREFQAGGDDEDRLVSPLVGSLERERGVLVDDPRWQESSFVLTYYKTEPCKRPPRLCRQGYACPFYHNNKDRRRSPKNFKYRSTPCPNVKLNDEWGDPAYCDQGHSCCYCHTRTEQQFHPEIYKSTKCNDVQQTGYCPRGPFCAFAHDEKELTAPRELTNEPMVTTPSPVLTGSSLVDSDSHHFPFHAVPQQTTSATPISSSPHNRSLPQPIGHPPERTGSSLSEGAFQRAPGAEVKSRSFEEEGQAYIRRQLQVIEGDASLDESERTRRKHNLLRLSLGSGGPGMSPEALQSHSLPSSVSDALEAMVGGGLDDLTLEDIDPTSSLAEEQQQQQSELIGTSILGQSPIAQSFMQSFPPQVSTASYPYSTPLGPLSPYGTSGQQGFAATAAQHQQQQQQQQAVVGGGASQRYSIITQSRPGGLGSPTKPSPMMQAAMGSPREKTEVATLREELRQAKTQLATWQEAWKQAKHAADLWKKEAEEAHHAARHATRRAEELDSKVKNLQMQGPVKMLAESADISKMSLSELEQVQMHMRQDIERIDTSRRHRLAALCMQCKEFPRCIHTQPCNHCVLCENCAEKMGDDAKCPYCNEPITKRTTVLLPF